MQLIKKLKFYRYKNYNGIFAIYTNVNIKYCRKYMQFVRLCNTILKKDVTSFYLIINRCSP